MRQEGINVILHRHGTAMVPRDAMGRIDLQMVADQQPGDTVAWDCQVAPGGNNVLSFLDVALDDVAAQDLSLVVTALQGFEQNLLESDTNPRPVHMVIGRDVAVRFANYYRGTHTDLDEFRALRERLLSVAQQGATASPPRHGSPLTIEVALTNDQVQMRLDAVSKQRLQGVHHGRFTPTGFFIEQTDWHDLIALHEREELINVVIIGLTGLSPEEVVALGGVSFVEDEREVLRWPKE